MTIREFFTDYSEDYIDLCIMEYPNDDSDAGDPNIYEATIYTDMFKSENLCIVLRNNNRTHTINIKSLNLILTEQSTLGLSHTTVFTLYCEVTLYPFIKGYNIIVFRE